MSNVIIFYKQQQQSNNLCTIKNKGRCAKRKFAEAYNEKKIYRTGVLSLPAIAAYVFVETTTRVISLIDTFIAVSIKVTSVSCANNTAQ